MRLGGLAFRVARDMAGTGSRAGGTGAGGGSRGVHNLMRMFVLLID